MYNILQKFKNKISLVFTKRNLMPLVKFPSKSYALTILLLVGDEFYFLTKYLF